jgi:predicted regulator of Ras-like GTPase activity (Roadblock/LC7/MglB family)
VQEAAVGDTGVAAIVAEELRLGAGMESTTNVVELAGVVIGYNHNVPYRGRIYHVQTEDSGRAKGRISTHVFHAGTIVASNRVDYDREMRVSSIVELARVSHKLMMRKLVHGELDGEIVRCRVTRASEPVLGAGSPANGPHFDKDEIFVGHRKRIQELIEVLDMDNINQTLENLRTNVAGALGVALVDYESGMCLGTAGTGLNMEIAAAGNMEVMKAKARVMRDLGIKGGIEDILITLESQYHIIRPIGSALFLYLALDRKQGNLALARHKLASAAAEVRT